LAGKLVARSMVMDTRLLNLKRADTTDDAPLWHFPIPNNGAMSVLIDFVAVALHILGYDILSLLIQGKEFVDGKLKAA